MEGERGHEGRRREGRKVRKNERFKTYIQTDRQSVRNTHTHRQANRHENRQDNIYIDKEKKSKREREKKENVNNERKYSFQWIERERSIILTPCLSVLLLLFFFFFFFLSLLTFLSHFS